MRRKTSSRPQELVQLTKLHHLHRTLSANHGKITQADLVASSGRRPLQTSEIPQQAATSSSGCNIKHVRLLAVSGHGSTSGFPCSLITEAAAAVPPQRPHRLRGGGLPPLANIRNFGAFRLRLRFLSGVVGVPTSPGSLPVVASVPARTSSCVGLQRNHAAAL